MRLLQRRETSRYSTAASVKGGDDRACEARAAEAGRVDVERPLAGMRRLAAADDDAERQQVRAREEEREEARPAQVFHGPPLPERADAVKSGTTVKTKP